MQTEQRRFRQNDAVQFAVTGRVLDASPIVVVVEWPASGVRTTHPPHQLRPATSPCCLLHGRNCEPEEPCCGRCTETSHDFQGFRTGQHADGSLCSNQDLGVLAEARTAAPEPRALLSEGDRMQAAIRFVLAFGQHAEPDQATLRKYDTDPEFHAAVRMAAELYLWKLDRERAEASGG